MVPKRTFVIDTLPTTNYPRPRRRSFCCSFSERSRRGTRSSTERADTRDAATSARAKRSAAPPPRARPAVVAMRLKLALAAAAALLLFAPTAARAAVGAKSRSAAAAASASLSRIATTAGRARGGGAAERFARAEVAASRVSARSVDERVPLRERSENEQQNERRRGLG